MKTFKVGQKVIFERVLKENSSLDYNLKISIDDDCSLTFTNEGRFTLGSNPILQEYQDFIDSLPEVVELRKKVDLYVDIINKLQNFQDLELDSLEAKIKKIEANQMPLVGQYYEFSDDGKHWEILEFSGFATESEIFNFSRSIKQHEEVLKAKELLKSVGYTKIEK